MQNKLSHAKNKETKNTEEGQGFKALSGDRYPCQYFKKLVKGRSEK